MFHFANSAYKKVSVTVVFILNHELVFGFIYLFIYLFITISVFQPDAAILQKLVQQNKEMTE
jgi:hypothetical protein